MLDLSKYVKKTNYRTLVTILRPNGEIETVEKTGELMLDKKMQDAAYVATRDAGRGLIKNFEWIWDDVPMTPTEIRQQLLDEKVAALEAWEAARDRDYARDIGMIESSKLEASVLAAEQAVKDFDANYPDVKAKKTSSNTYYAN